MTYSEFLEKGGEKKHQDRWEKEKLFEAQDFSDKEKFYCLVEFPYPSGEGLHVGHPRSYTALDILARKRRMDGQNVLYPMGWDAYGLPAENYAIKTGTHPKIKTKENIKNYKHQLQMLGYSFDWSREVNTTDPKYYKWTQWIFLQMFKKGLAYKSEMPINFCTDCKVGLANEEVVSGKCERCGGEVIQKMQKQWMLKITEYADRLANDLDKVDYLERIKSQQRNWIGRSEGIDIDYPIVGSDQTISCYSTRPDTNFGATFVVIAPEHPLVLKLTTDDNKEEVKEYIKQAAKKSDLERTELEKEKTGVFTGSSCLNRLTNKEMPIYVSDFVVATAGTGIVVGVPAHDERDWQFAKKYKLEMIPVIKPKCGKKWDYEKAAFTDIDDALVFNSDFLNDIPALEAKDKIIECLVEKGWGKKAVNFKLRDWVFSRQRYWGEPIPIVDCPNCGLVAIDESELPLELPEVEEYLQSEDGESPLAKIDEWVNVKCPKCGSAAKRETDTMPQWAGSSWYYLRYMDPSNDKALASEEKLKYWNQVDWYNGGMEHTTLHLLYSRFWHKFLFDIGVVPTDEPYAKRTSHGMILGENGEKMSKSRGNVINPDDVVKEYGADTLRVYEMFMGPFDQMIPWDTKGVIGVRRFLEKVWSLGEINIEDNIENDVEVLLNKTIKKVGEDIETMRYNTAVSSMMILVNKILEVKKINREGLEKLLIILSAFAPHITDELWAKLGHKESIALQSWPKYDESKIKDDLVDFVIQINGKVRAKLQLAPDISEKDAVKLAQEDDNVKKHLDGQKIKKTIFVAGRLISFVV